MKDKFILETVYKVNGKDFSKRTQAQNYVTELEEEAGLRQTLVIIYANPDVKQGCYGFTKIHIFKLVNQDENSSFVNLENIRKLVENILSEKGPKYLGIQNSLNLMRNYKVETMLVKEFNEDLSFVTYIKHGEKIDCDKFENNNLNKTLEYLREILKIV